ncbi:MAG TPA: ferredoxin--nitrite reductase [Patescibacteria group bacterium]|nr:ferredoxin--nitrite reductase [Patescibacteria group bacterium]
MILRSAEKPAATLAKAPQQHINVAPSFCPYIRRPVMNKIEELKIERDGLDVGKKIETFAQQGWETIPEGDIERLKWHGIFARKHTPGFFMMRIRIPNGIASVDQARMLAQISRQFGRGLMDITTRQQLQLRWIRIEQVPEILRRLQEAGLTSLQTGMDTIRNVVGCPVAGIGRDELLDATPVVYQFTSMFVGNRAFTNLPRKFNVVITGCTLNCTHAESQDLGLTPATREIDGKPIAGFNVQIGGKMGSGGYRIASPLDLFVRPEEAAEICALIAMIYRDHGPREARSLGRLAFLIDEWGIERFQQELTHRAGRLLEHAGRDARKAQSADHIGIYRQQEAGLNYAGLVVPVGRITADQLLELARLSERYGRGELRFTVGQNVIIPHISDTQLGDFLAEPLLQTFRYDPDELMRGLVTCTGNDYCNMAMIDTKGRALEVVQALSEKLPGVPPVTVHWSGCPAGCGNHQGANIGLQGTKTRINDKTVEAVNIFVGGRSGPKPQVGQMIMADVPCSQLADVMKGLVQFYPRKKPT